ncbi:MAG: nucleoside deaminase [Thermodesulfobacteriota bacterium]|nr:nucleoside deaminase [Thermodesulfobacteriota bacterium]
MEFALNEAEKAFKKGEFPVGCVIVYQGRVVSTGSRKGTMAGRGCISEIDHAEIRALKNLEKAGLEFDPVDAVLFCTMEPCLMCFAATILSGIKKIVYAYEDPMGGGTGCDFSKLTPLYRESRITVVSGVLREKSLDFFKDFFKKEDNLYWKESLLEQYTLKQ